MVNYKEDYKGYEIRLAKTGEGWEYEIPTIRGYRRPMSYTSKERALEIAKGIIDRLINS